MNVNVAPICRYAFLLEKPVLYFLKEFGLL